MTGDVRGRKWIWRKVNKREAIDHLDVADVYGMDT